MSFASALEHVLAVEGGYSNHPADAGGPTNFGITQAELASWRGLPATAEDVRTLQKSEAVAIYRKRYWDKMSLDLVEDPEVQLVLMDQGVNRGISTAVTQAQVVLARMGKTLSADGAIGPITRKALAAVDPDEFSREFIQASELAYADICVRKPDQLVFLKGWLNRVHALQDRLWTGETAPVEITPPKPDESPEPVHGALDPMAPYRWALKELGQSEIGGSKHNPRIVWYHRFTSLKATTDEVPWCSSFICAAAESCGFKSTRSAAAKSWATYGEAGDGSVGDIAVLTRSGGNHVTFFNKPYKKGDKTFSGLGGNQGNRVSIANQDAGRLIAIRRFPSGMVA